MALPTGTISMSQVNTELGRSATATISLGESAVRTLAGVASGAISMQNLKGKSNAPTFTPAGGDSAGTAVLLEDEAFNSVGSVLIECSASATWTYTRIGANGSPATGSNSATSRLFTLTNPTTSFMFTSWDVSATVGGVTKYWRVQISHSGTT
jgi:hypothetical protein